MNETSSVPTSADIPTDVPLASRAYGYLLGGKDTHAVDREFIHSVLQTFPECLDIARQNRMFLYRAVRYLAEEAGIRQFLDLGSGYPTERNVHHVAQEFRPDSRVVYVDSDPVVLLHGRAFLADNPNTTVVTADMTDPDQILSDPDVTRLIDFSEPVALLMFSIPHCIPGDDDAYRAIRGPLERVVPGSHLAISHVVADDQESADEMTAVITDLGMPWQTRTPARFAPWLADLEPVDPGLVDVNTWRPDPDQPQLSEVASEIAPYLGASRLNQRVYECGGVFAKS
ncbi:S-adenosyl methyltransferase [Haloactinospora alba]|uniref:S-adenosyl methyltransferase n=1 Tax=Haloactinospora alba TaxID=405555 RepID=A0A543NL48_9ACTN|nr:SAM-dependent methyltransferase [Haloactinospora alba]TQN32517.1 S-adenosyl methyltransferase [Haloactinospora alba]